MIVRILSAGTSFKGLATYLTHDPKTETAERVEWTHTHNLTHDHVPSAVDEMLWTARNAELLKQEAGVRAGGRSTENVVKHLSLNWAPDEQPTREHMIETAEAFLRHMKWQDHQALMVAHDDKAHSHVHLAINMVHPETGLHLDDNFERRRAQAWALAYEKEQGRIYCEQRLLNPEEREDAPTRPAWLILEKNREKFERAPPQDLDKSMTVSEDATHFPPSDWKKLKEIQRHERQAFFAEGKIEFSELRRSIYSEIRGDFRDKWSEFFEARRDGGDADALAAMKAAIVAEQQAAFEARSKEAFKELRTTRDGLYRDLLNEQMDIRHAMRARQDAGLDNGLFLDRIQKRHDHEMPEAQAQVATPSAPTHQKATDTTEGNVINFPHTRNRSGMRSPSDVAGNVGIGVGFGLISLLGSIADGLTGSTPAPHRQPEPSEPDIFDRAAEDTKRQDEPNREDAEVEWRKRQRSLEGE